MKHQKLLYRTGRTGAFIYSEGNPWPLDIDNPTNESATYDQSLLEQKFTDIFFEKPQNEKMIMTIIIIIGVVIIGLLALFLILKNKGA